MGLCVYVFTEWTCSVESISSSYATWMWLSVLFCFPILNQCEFLLQQWCHCLIVWHWSAGKGRDKILSSALMINSIRGCRCYLLIDCWVNIYAGRDGGSSLLVWELRECSTVYWRMTKGRKEFMLLSIFACKHARKFALFHVQCMLAIVRTRFKHFTVITIIRSSLLLQ